MNTLRNERKYKDPQYIDILSEDDRKLYKKMQISFGSQEYRYNRNRRISISKDIFDHIRNYCERKEEDQAKRYLVCGICWYDQYIGINTKQFGCLISKSKSTINDVISKMGYSAISFKGEPVSMLFEKIPLLFGNQIELKKWTIRQKKNYQNEIINEITEKNATDSDKEEEKDDGYIFFDQFDQNFDQNETENDSSFFDENVNEYFDFGFGYDQDMFLCDSCLCNCTNEFNPIHSFMDSSKSL